MLNSLIIWILTDWFLHSVLVEIHELKFAWFSSLKFRSDDPVEVFIASPSPVVFTGYEVGQVYEVCIKFMWQNFHMVTSDSEQITPHTLSVMGGYKFVPFSLSFIATDIR